MSSEILLNIDMNTVNIHFQLVASPVQLLEGLFHPAGMAYL